MTLSTAAIAKLKDIFHNDQLLFDPADCWPYGYDNSKLHHAPDAVVLPSHHDQVVKCVSLCNEFNIPLTTRGRGTGTTGACVPISGGISLSCERMTQVINFNRGNRSVRVQSGITNLNLQNFLNEKGFFWGPDPSSAEFCTVGGNIACNAAGPRAIKYGTTRDNLLALKVVTGEGHTLETGSKTTKGVVGLDLTRLITGSEGTLAIVTEAELKILPLTEKKHTIRALYKHHQGACEAIQELTAQQHLPCAIEFIDHHAINLIRTHTDLNIPEQANAMLMVEIDGDDEYLNISSPKLMHALSNQYQVSIELAQTSEDRTSLWKARKALSPILRNLAPNKINEDVVVPVPNLAALIDHIDQLSKQHDIPIVNFGHAGNGNIHVNILYDQTIPSQNQAAEICLEKIFDEVLRLEGTLSGEHGIGLVKKDYVQKELDHNAIDLMHRLKMQFDPNQILNPGKSLPI